MDMDTLYDECYREGFEPQAAEFEHARGDAMDGIGPDFVFPGNLTCLS